ncbi:hypothetical protein MHYP_G00276870 [Metynnis hypsauchen]
MKLSVLLMFLLALAHSSGSHCKENRKNQEDYNKFSEKHILSMDIKGNLKVKELKDIFERYLLKQDLCGRVALQTFFKRTDRNRVESICNGQGFEEEYDSGAAVTALEPILPYSYNSPSEVTFHIKALSSEYIPTVTENATRSFLSELQKVARLSRKSYEDILREQLLRCRETGAPVSSEPVNELGAELSNTGVQSEGAPPTMPQPQTAERVPHDKAVEQAEFPQNPMESMIFRDAKENEVPLTAMGYANPPEVQRLVVEHVVRSEAPMSLMNASFRLRQFSGRSPCPSHETDFDTWRNSAFSRIQLCLTYSAPGRY